MKKYIGFKLVEAEPEIKVENEVKKDGYKVVYPDGYVSWSPQTVFDAAHLEVADNNMITQELVDSMIKAVHVSTALDKTTVVVA